MKLLLDTHLLLWWLEEHPSLSGRARERIADPSHTIFVSAVTHWEIRIKAGIGKLKVPANFAERMEGEGFESLPFTEAHARRVGELPWVHRDPFDRALVAQAAVEGLTLLTTDAVMAGYGDVVEVA